MRSCLFSTIFIVFSSARICFATMGCMVDDPKEWDNFLVNYVVVSLVVLQWMLGSKSM